MEQFYRILTVFKMFSFFLLLILSCVYGQQAQPAQQQVPVQQQGQVRISK